MPDITFIIPYPEGVRGINEATVEPSLAIGYLSAVAEKKGVSCSIIDANIFCLNADSVISELKKDIPKIVGITVNLYTYQASLKLTNRLKRHFPGIIVILGGPAPSSSPLKMIYASEADAVCVGEGEETLREIIDNFRQGMPLFKDVSGLFFRQGAEIIKNKPRGFIKDIDKIPFPAYHLFPDLGIYRSRARKKPVAPLLTSRGCPFNCIYCSKDVFKDLCRMRSPENVIEEVGLLVERYGVRQIDILDDNFTIDKKRTERILDLLIDRNYDICINLQTGIRAEGIDEGIIRKMKKAKVWKMSVGVESGDEAVLKRIKKQPDLDRVLNITKMAKKYGIIVYGFFMIGLPGDTEKTMQKTIDFAVKMDPDIANFCITTPFPGTELYEMVKRNGKMLIDIEDGAFAGFYANEVFYVLGNMDRETVLRYYKKALKDFYLRPRKILELAAGCRSLEELKWFFNVGTSMMKSAWR